MELLFFLYGLVFGSFFNVIIDRVPEGISPWRGRSRCDHCKRILRWYELIPLASFILQGGKCRRCHTSLSIEYPLVELATAFIFVYVYHTSSGNWIISVANLIIFSAFLINFVIDLKHQILLDTLHYVALVGIVLKLLVSTSEMTQWLPFVNSAIGAGLFFAAIWFITRGRGMGFGDVKLGFVIGLFTGFPEVVYALYIAFLTGALLGVILIIGKVKKLKSRIAFGPFLIAGAMIATAFSPYIEIWLKGIIW